MNERELQRKREQKRRRRLLVARRHQELKWHRDCCREAGCQRCNPPVRSVRVPGSLGGSLDTFPVGVPSPTPRLVPLAEPGPTPWVTRAYRWITGRKP